MAPTGWISPTPSKPPRKVPPSHLLHPPTSSALLPAAPACLAFRHLHAPDDSLPGSAEEQHGIRPSVTAAHTGPASSLD